MLLAVMVFWGGFLRFYQLGQQSLWIDEGYTINAAQAILDHGYPLLGSGASYNTHTFHNYITALSMKLFGFDPQSPWSARLPAALFGALSILAIYYFVKKISRSSLAGLATSFLMAFSYWEIAWSRQARGYTDMQFFILLSFIFFFEWLENKKVRDGLLTLAFFGLSYLSHGIALIFVPSFCLIFLAHSIWSGKIKELISPIAIIFFIILGGFAAWLILYVLPPISVSPYAKKYISFLFDNFHYLSILALTILVGLFWGKKNRWETIYLAGVVMPSTAIIIFFARVIQMRYLLSVFPFLLVAASAGLYLLIVKEDYIKPIYRDIIYIIVIGALASTVATFIPQSTYKLEIGSPQPNFKNGYRAIGELRKEGDIILSPYAHLSKIYLGDRGLWLPISLTGRKSEIATYTINGGDYYTGAPIIPDAESLKHILDTNHGYIVMDSMAKIRLRDWLPTIIENPRVVIVYYEENNNSRDFIAVYGFGVENVSIPNY